MNDLGDADGSPAFIEADAPTDDELDALLHTLDVVQHGVCRLAWRRRAR